MFVPKKTDVNPIDKFFQLFLGKAASFLGKAASFNLSKGILTFIALNSLFLFIFGTIDFQKTLNYQRTENSILLCIQA
jgi:hypothetical protein